MTPRIHWIQAVAILAAMATVQAVVFDQVRLFGVIRLDLMVLVVVAVGLRSDAVTSSTLGFVVGLFTDLFRYGPFGLHALVFAIAGHVLAVNRLRMLQVNQFADRVQQAVAVVLVTAAIWTGAAVFGLRPPPFGNESLIQIALTGVVGALALTVVERVVPWLVLPPDTRSTPEVQRA